MRLACPFLFLTLLLFASCNTVTPLFQSEDRLATESTVYKRYFQAGKPTIQPGDKVTVSIWGHDELSIGSANDIFNASEGTGRWIVVSRQGEVNLPKIGRIKLAGYTIEEANFVLEQRFAEHLQDPVINVKVLNHQVTVLGEVNQPGKYNINNEAVSLVQVLGLAEGLTDYADPQTIQIIRETGAGQPVELTADLTQFEDFSRYNVLLQPGDVVYVAPKKSIKRTDDNLQRLTPIAAVITALAVVLSVITR